MLKNEKKKKKKKNFKEKQVCSSESCKLVKFLNNHPMQEFISRNGAEKLFHYMIYSFESNFSNLLMQEFISRDGAEKLFIYLRARLV
jgi:hypothetical protein